MILIRRLCHAHQFIEEAARTVSRGDLWRCGPRGKRLYKINLVPLLRRWARIKGTSDVFALPLNNI